MLHRPSVSPFFKISKIPVSTLFKTHFVDAENSQNFDFFTLDPENQFFLEKSTPPQKSHFPANGWHLRTSRLSSIFQ